MTAKKGTPEMVAWVEEFEKAVCHQREAFTRLQADALRYGDYCVQTARHRAATDLSSNEEEEL